MAWTLLINETDAGGFDVDAPLVMASWQDAGSGVLAFVLAALALTAYEPKETALRIVGSAVVAGGGGGVFFVFFLLWCWVGCGEGEGYNEKTNEEKCGFGGVAY